MATPKVKSQELLTALQKIKDLPILVVGDVMLDRYIWGSVDRVSPEAPVPVVHTNKVESRLGGAGNVVRNLCNIGAKVTLCGFIGNDIEGEQVLEQLDLLNVVKDGIIIDRTRPTIIKTRVIAQRQQIVRIDREDLGDPSTALTEGMSAVFESYIDSTAGIVISDYGKGAISPSVLNKLAKFTSEGKLGINGKPVILDPHPKNFSHYKNVHVIKPNRKEAEKAAGILIVDHESAIKAARILIDKWSAQSLLITLGELGLVLVDRDSTEPLILETVAVEVFDVSGAGDTVTSIMAAALAGGATPKVAATLANIGGGIVVAEVGTAAITLDKLQEEIELYEAISIASSSAVSERSR